MRNVICLCILILFTLAVPAAAIQWIAAQKTCPFDGSKTIFKTPSEEVGPPADTQESRFDMVFWPMTDELSWYRCPNCKLCAFMKDFERIPKESFPKLTTALAAIPDSTATGSYASVPITERLEAAELVYIAIGKDQEFMGRFYRVMGYFQDQAGQSDKAAVARRRALDIATALSSDPGKSGLQREQLIIMAAMNHKLGNNAEALKLLQKSTPMRFKNNMWKDAENAAWNKALAEITEEYTNKLAVIEKETQKSGTQ